MIAVKILRDGNGKRWEAWLAVDSGHARRDAELMGGFLLDTLCEVPLADVVNGLSDTACYLAGEKVVLGIERQCGQKCIFIPGTTAFYLGSLMPREAHRGP